MNKHNFEWAKLVPVFVLAVLLIIIYQTFDNITGITSEIRRFLWVISPLLFGVLFAYFLYSPCLALDKVYKRSKTEFISTRSRGFSVITLFVLLAALFVFILRVIIPVLIYSIVDLALNAEALINQLLDYLDDLPEGSVWVEYNIVGRLEEYADNFVSQFISADFIEELTRRIMSFADGVMNIVLGLIMSLYILLEHEKIKEFFRRLNKALFSSEKARGSLNKYLERVNKVLITFIASKGLDSIINLTVVTSILLIFRVQYAFLLGLMAGVLNFIPYLGSLIAVAIISTLTFLTAGSGRAIPVVICLLIFQQLDGNFIEPRIMRTSLKISPILVIISVLTGGAYFGIIGMFLAVPVVTIIKQILLEYISNAE